MISHAMGIVLASAMLAALVARLLDPLPSLERMHP